MTERNDLNFLLENEIKNGIITSIRVFGALKLKKISTLLGKTESTVIAHLKELERRGYIERDPEKHEERGKFYILTKKCNDIFDQISEKYVKEDFDEGIQRFKQMTKEEYNKIIIQGIKERFSQKDSNPLQSIQAGAIINSNITKIIRQDFKDVIAKVNNENDESNLNYIFLANVSMSMLTIPVETPSHVAKISELTNDYLKKLRVLEDEISKEIIQMKGEKKTENNQYIFLFLGPLSGSLSSKQVVIVPI